MKAEIGFGPLVLALASVAVPTPLAAQTLSEAFGVQLGGQDPGLERKGFVKIVWNDLWWYEKAVSPSSQVNVNVRMGIIDQIGSKEYFPSEAVCIENLAKNASQVRRENPNLVDNSNSARNGGGPSAMGLAEWVFEYKGITVEHGRSITLSCTPFFRGQYTLNIVFSLGDVEQQSLNERQRGAKKYFPR